MSIKSSWAYRNGKRIEIGCQPDKSPKSGWVNIRGVLQYAERDKYNPSKLRVKTYANKAQAFKMVERLRADGIDCGMSISHPFIIIKK